MLLVPAFENIQKRNKKVIFGLDPRIHEKQNVILGLDPRIQAALLWILATSASMTKRGKVILGLDPRIHKKQYKKKGSENEKTDNSVSSF